MAQFPNKANLLIVDDEIYQNLCSAAFSAGE